MLRARIRPRFARSQYSNAKSLVDGYDLIIEGKPALNFATREAAKKYAISKGYKLAYSEYNNNF